MSTFKKNMKEAKSAAGEVLLALLNIVTLGALGALLINKRARPTVNTFRKAGLAVGKRYGKVVTSEVTFALVSTVVIEFLAWPLKIVFAIWRAGVVWTHLHDKVYLGNHGGLTVDLLFTEQIYQVVVPCFALALVIGALQKMALIRLGLVSGAAGFIGGLLKGVTGEDLNVQQKLAARLDNAGNGWAHAGGIIFRKVQNENWWNTACDILIIATPWGAGFMHPYWPMIVAALSVKGLWEINTSNGNNTDDQGNMVLETEKGGNLKPYHVRDRRTGEVTVGYKPQLAGFQLMARGGLGLAIAMMAIFTYLGFTGFFLDIKHRERIESVTTQEMRKINRGRDREVRRLTNEIEAITSASIQYDSLTSIREEMASTTPPDNWSEARQNQFWSDQDARIAPIDAQLDSLEELMGRRSDLARLERQVADLSSVDTMAVRDSVAELAADRVNTFRALLPGKIDLTAKYSTPNGLPPIEDERKIKERNNWLNDLLISTDNRTNGLQDYLLWIAILAGLVWFATKKAGPWIKLVLFFLALWVFVTRSGVYSFILGWGTPVWATAFVATVLGAILLLILFAVLTPNSHRGSSAHAH